MADLQEIMGRMNIGENAVRTAMSRLASDGWVRREKVGRQSFYSLAAEGFSVFESASQRIYNSGEFEWSGLFEIFLRPHDDHKKRMQSQSQLRQLGYGSPMSDVYVRPVTPYSPSSAGRSGGSIILKSSELAAPSLFEFIERCWPVGEISKQCQQLVDRLSPLHSALEADQFDDPLDCLAARILLIHEWRKLVLRNVDIPDSLRPANDAVANARSVVGSIYRLLLSPSEFYLDQCKGGPDRVLSSVDSSVAKRFSS